MLFESVRRIICEQLCIDEQDVSLGSRLYEDLDADELDMVDIAMTIEDDFHVEITEEALESFSTVEDVVHFLEEKL